MYPQPLFLPLPPVQVCPRSSVYQMQPWRSVILLGCAVTLQGCISFSSRQLEPEVTAAALESRRLDSAEVRAALKREGIGVGRAWSLTHLAAASRHLNPELAVLRARVQTAEGGLETAGERPNPVLSFKPGYNSSSHGISPWIIEPGLDFTIETGGKREARRAEAMARVRVARLDLEAASWKVRAEVRRALLAIHAAMATGGEARSQESAQATAARLLESQLRDGAARPQDVAAARIPLNQTRLALHDVDLLAMRSRAQLATAIGVPVSAFRGIDFDFSEVTRMRRPPPGRTARRHALTHRADILAALADYAASEEHLRLEVAKQFPNITLGPGYKLDQTDNEWTLGIGFELPSSTSTRAQSPRPRADGRRRLPDSMPCRRRLSAKSTSRSPPTGQFARKPKRPAVWLPRSRRRRVPRKR